MNQKKTNKSKLRSQRKGDSRAKAIPEYTAGGIAYRTLGDGKIEFLLMQDHRSRWTIPKGHVESGETLEQTALREMQEETGLAKLKIVDKLDKVHFFYRREGKLIFMTTFIFLMEALDPEEPLVLEDTDWVQDLKWFPADQARALIEYKGTKLLLDISVKKLREAGLNV
jgi:8-oxo-dGTP pyrophosphatase MutT (NUDIX family)